MVTIDHSSRAQMGREPDIQRDLVPIDIRGRCLCGRVQFFASGTPLQQFYCHCRSCQSAHSAPFVAGAQFSVSEVRIIGDTRIVRVTSHPDATPRVICSNCGTRVMSDRVLEISDNLPKYLDFPAVFGGSDEHVD
jgi:hypothetical protein